MTVLRFVLVGFLISWLLTTEFPVAIADDATAVVDSKIETSPATETPIPKNAESERPPWMSEAEVKRHGWSLAVDIEIIGRDAQGKWASRGSGSILHEDGYILTCEHVTAVGETHKVYLGNGKSYDYRVLGRAGGSYDTAILKIEPKEKLPCVKLGHSKKVKKGERVMVIGNPDGRRHTVNFGEIEKATCGGGTQIQIGKADIREGDSGGPVFNLRGEQIAHVHVKITTLNLTSRHIRVDHTRAAFAKVFMDESRSDYSLGIKVDCHADEAKVTGVKSDSPAHAAGIRRGDIVLRMDDMQIREGPHFVLALLDKVTAEPMTIVVKRGQREISASVAPRRQSRS